MDATKLEPQKTVMGLAYPLADTARAALDAPEDLFFKTLAEARDQSGARVVLSTQWLKPETDEADALREKADAFLGKGFVQVYENADGETVLAVSFWKTLSPSEADAADKEAERLRAERAVEHTNDTYFASPEERRKRFRNRRKRKREDPKQLDLFPGPDQQGHESPDPNNPNVIIVDSEGDGTTFGN